ncbi:unnamed protein product [Caenorhabditis bovis]|uniref:Prefoldin subunit 5 n=1 Tax=Caenorhabditis bovis TaxID=2654633 RepID=A0A8S1EX02_9PELO|nr:unnamed protein product [Caenorhabditis bovis]
MSGEEPKMISLNELGMEQLNALQKQVEQEMQFFQESATTLKMLMTRNEKSIEALEDVKTATPGHSALVPLSESLYIRAELSDPSKHLVEIGTGYFVELDREKAKAVFERKRENITKQVETVEKILLEKRRTRAVICDTFQQKLQAQLAQINMAGK